MTHQIQNQGNIYDSVSNDENSEDLNDIFQRGRQSNIIPPLKEDQTPSIQQTGKTDNNPQASIRIGQNINLKWPNVPIIFSQRDLQDLQENYPTNEFCKSERRTQLNMNREINEHEKNSMLLITHTPQDQIKYMFKKTETSNTYNMKTMERDKPKIKLINQIPIENSIFTLPPKNFIPPIRQNEYVNWNFCVDAKERYTMDAHSDLLHRFELTYDFLMLYENEVLFNEIYVPYVFGFVQFIRGMPINWFLKQKCFVNFQRICRFNKQNSIDMLKRPKILFTDGTIKYQGQNQSVENVLKSFPNLVEFQEEQPGQYLNKAPILKELFNHKFQLNQMTSFTPKNIVYIYGPYHQGKCGFALNKLLLQYKANEIYQIQTLKNFDCPNYAQQRAVLFKRVHFVKFDFKEIYNLLSARIMNIGPKAKTSFKPETIYFTSAVSLNELLPEGNDDNLRKAILNLFTEVYYFCSTANTIYQHVADFKSYAPEPLFQGSLDQDFMKKVIVGPLKNPFNTTHLEASTINEIHERIQSNKNSLYAHLGNAVLIREDFEKITKNLNENLLKGNDLQSSTVFVEDMEEHSAKVLKLIASIKENIKRIKESIVPSIEIVSTNEIWKEVKVLVPKIKNKKEKRNELLESGHEKEGNNLNRPSKLHTGQKTTESKLIDETPKD